MKTFFIIKPDGVANNIIGTCLKEAEQAGLKVTDLKMTHATESQLENHYSHIKDKPFFKNVVSYMTEGPIVVGVLEGHDAVTKWRDILGATDPKQAIPNSLRGRFGANANGDIKNVAHGSDSEENAEREIKIWM